MTKKEILDYLQPINTEHVEAAMRKIDSDGVPSGRMSQIYCVVDPLSGTKYPPPYLIELSFNLATGNELPLGFFSKIKKDGGHFEKLKSLGFKVVDKVDPMLILIESYKAHIRESELKDELYKWELIQKFKGRPDVSAPDFAEELRSINYGNFLYAMSNGVIRGLAKQAPEEMRLYIKDLLDESKPLKGRIEEYGKSTLALYRSLDPENKNSHHQDERTVATILTFFKPDKYTLYKSSFYTKYCEFLGLKQKGKGEKYIHYLELIQDVVNKYILKDEELLELVAQFIPSTAYPDTEHLILAQDILYHHFNKYSSVDFFKIIEQFIAQAKTNDLKTAFYPKIYEGLFMNVSFGKGGADKIPWISLTKEPNTTSNGIYPVFIYYKEYEKLVLAYGISETEVCDFSWPNIEGAKTIDEWHQQSFQKPPYRYGASYLKGFYETENLNKEQIISDLEEIIDTYNTIDFTLSDNQETIQTINNTTKAHPLNQILYGPPGTGKTYSTIDKVVQICDFDYKSNDHQHNKVIYDRLVKEGRVVFTTFHQSLSYEDFIEGIKPVKPGDDDTFLKYDIEPGIFKQISNTAKSLKIVQSNIVDWENVTYYKMSIGGKNRPDIHNWCIENKVVGLSWGGDEDISELVQFAQTNNWKDYRDNFKELFKNTAEENRYNIQATYIFNKMKVGDVVVISKGNHVIDAIGKITSEYFFDDQTPTDMLHFRKVEWIATNMDASPDKFIDKQISQQSIYEFFNDDVKKEIFKSLTNTSEEDTKPYVIVIDEINRGNVSTVFGELITLIEEDKRLEAKNELKVTLPYSKEKFGIPSNLYILGTMNTADRSVEALDTALRRRFSFVEMLPNPSLLVSENNQPLVVNDINIQDLLHTINKRIEFLVDRDHTIGHAFFIGLDSISALKSTFKNKIIPLLQEYFYGNYYNIELVLGSGFFNKKEKSKVKFALDNTELDTEGFIYDFINLDSLTDDEFIKLLNDIKIEPYTKQV